ncbi:MAG: 2-isopropylmalate synthase, partial [Maribacter arcticus]
MRRKLEIMDTTLRDGEQTSGVSFSASEKLTLAKLLLDELKVDRIEVASARVSDGELEAVQKITEWAATKGYLERVEVLTFVDGGISLDWMQKSGAISQNLLTKGSLNHLEHQLKKTPKQHFSEISEIFKNASERGIINNIYLEDWSNGMRNSKAYVFEFLEFLSTQPVKRILLPDTLGILTHTETYAYISEIVQKFPDLHFDFHGH